MDDLYRYNQASHPLPFMKSNSSVAAPKKTAHEKPDLEEAIEESDEGEVLEEPSKNEDDEDADLSKDKYVKQPKKKRKGANGGGAQASSSGGKGKATGKARDEHEDDEDEDESDSVKPKRGGRVLARAGVKEEGVAEGAEARSRSRKGLHPTILARDGHLARRYVRELGSVCKSATVGSKIRMLFCRGPARVVTTDASCVGSFVLASCLAAKVHPKKKKGVLVAKGSYVRADDTAPVVGCLLTAPSQSVQSTVGHPSLQSVSLEALNLCSSVSFLVRSGPRRSERPRRALVAFRGTLGLERR